LAYVVCYQQYIIFTLINILRIRVYMYYAALEQQGLYL